MACELDSETNWRGRSSELKKWYVIQVHSGVEQKVAESIRDAAATSSVGGQIGDVLVPTEEVVSVRRGRRVSSERKFYPGYILINMEMTDASWHIVNSTAKVIGFPGKSKRPLPITEKEAQRILRQVKEGVDHPRPAVIFEVGEQVRVCDGPFTSFNGVVEEVDHDKSRLKVIVSIFSRATPVDLDYAQVEKL